MHEFVRENQNAFIEGRKIMDNVLIANELICHLMRKKQKRYLLKLDFHRAFDSVILYYLDEILARMGFGDPSMPFYR